MTPTTPRAPEGFAPAALTARRYVELDGLRALSVLAVFLFHMIPAAPALFGQTLFGLDPDSSIGVFGFTVRPPIIAIEYAVHLNVGVQIFFVLSGFLITSMFVRPLLASPSGDPLAVPALARYAVRRAARIFPAYWCVLFIAGVTWFGVHELEFPLPYGVWKHASLTYLYFREWSPPGFPVGYGGLSVAWSLVAEVTFYAFVPAWAWLVTRSARDTRRAAMVGAIACIPVGVACVFVFGYANAWSEHTILGGVITVFGAGLISLGIGMVLAVVVALARGDGARTSTLERVGARAARWWIAAAAVYLVLVWPEFPYLQASGGQQVRQRLVQPVIAGLLVAPMVLAPGAASRVHRVLRTKLLTWIGTVSYGIYLWHTLVVDRVLEWHGLLEERNAWIAMRSVALAWVITLGVAAASWYALERPILSVTSRMRR